MQTRPKQKEREKEAPRLTALKSVENPRSSGGKQRNTDHRMSEHPAIEERIGVGKESSEDINVRDVGGDDQSPKRASPPLLFRPGIGDGHADERVSYIVQITIPTFASRCRWA